MTRGNAEGYPGGAVPWDTRGVVGPAVVPRFPETRSNSEARIKDARHHGREEQVREKRYTAWRSQSHNPTSSRNMSSSTM